jgi:putative ABC transport system substrate-binding protein
MPPSNSLRRYGGWSGKPEDFKASVHEESRVALGFAQSLARPGGNLTGMSNFSVDIAGKRIELLKELVPELTRLAVWYNPEAVNEAVEMSEVEAAAGRFGIQLLAIKANKPAEYQAAAETTRDWGAHGMYLNSNPAAYANRAQIIALRRRQKSRPCITKLALLRMAG